jgi:hypothetical protein
LLRSKNYGTLVLVGIFLACACYFATFGTGNYTYAAAIGDIPEQLLEDSTQATLTEPEGAPETLESALVPVPVPCDSEPPPETLDDDFDLLDIDPTEPNP